MKLSIPFLRKRKEHFKRAFKRHDCAIDTTMTLIDRMIDFEGRITDISCGGAMFRPKLAYIMDRSATPILLHLGAEELFGHIINTSPRGFSIRWDDPLDDELFDDLVGDLLPKEEKAA